MSDFDRSVRESQGGELLAAAVRTVQVNLGYRCNLCCRHCHVGGGPNRGEVMAWPTMESVVRLASAFPGCQVDITGGAPELNPNFVRLVESLRRKGHPVLVRTNLTVIFDPGMEAVPEFYRANEVQLVASLPCYMDANVNAQRGGGVFDKSVAAIARLNELGYGREPGLALDLVYNPGGASLPPAQEGLEAAYRSNLKESHGLDFTRLLTITNMPIGRFLEDLERQGKDEEYRQLLASSFNPETVPGLMCRHQICVAWDGTLADCDFNQVLGLTLAEGHPRHIDDLDPTSLEGRRIVTGEHCFGCTAGSGSSCGGALVA